MYLSSNIADMKTENKSPQTYKDGINVTGPSCHHIRIILKDAADEIQPEFRHHWKEQFSLLYEGMPQENVLQLIDRSTADWKRDEVIYHYQPEPQYDYNIIVTITEAPRLFSIERVVEGSVMPVLLPSYEEAMQERKNIIARLETEQYKDTLFKMEFLRYRGYKKDKDLLLKEIYSLLGLDFNEKNELRITLNKEYAELSNEEIARVTGLDLPLVIVMRHLHYSPEQFFRYLVKYTPEQQERFIDAHISKLERRKKMYTTSPINDPIEQLPENQRDFNEVDDIVDAQITRTGQGVCHAKWRLKKELLRKRGIDWMSPSDMNPRNTFE